MMAVGVGIQYSRAGAALSCRSNSIGRVTAFQAECWGFESLLRLQGRLALDAK